MFKKGRAETANHHPQVSKSGTLAYRIVAVSALSLGGIGAVLPLLPTTPFVLLAVWAAGRGSPELNARIRAHPRFGPVIANWEQDGAVPMLARVAAIVMMAISWSTLWFSGAGPVLLGGLGIFFAALLIFLLSRPLPDSRS